jgi:gamma-glutamylputrescine oxidase
MLGQRVVGVDASMVGGGAAGRNGGFLLAGLAAFHHEAVARIGRDRARALYGMTVAEIERIARETPSAVHLSGSLRLASSPEEEADCRQHLAALHDDGFPAEWYEGAEGRGVLLPTDGAFDPLARCRALASMAQARGARLFERSPAVTIADGVVHCPEGSVVAREVIVAVDGGLECVLPELAARVRTARLQMLGTAPAPEVRFRRPVYARWGLDYWQQLPDDRIVLGGFRDVGGDAEWTTRAEPTAPVQEALERFLRDTLGVRAPITHRWAASVAYTQLGLPVLEEVRPHTWAVGAYSGTGNVVGALCGRAAARLVVRRVDTVAALVAG